MNDEQKRSYQESAISYQQSDIGRQRTVAAMVNGILDDRGLFLIFYCNPKEDSLSRFAES